MLEELKERVYKANLGLVELGLVIFTWGNVSAVDRNTGLIVIKPSGVDYEAMKPGDMAVVDFTGRIVEGSLNPSSDTPTHIELYKAFPRVGGVVHTHSKYATAFAQSGRELPAYGTTHADYFRGPVPCTRALYDAETASEYERNTGLVIAETFAGLDPGAVPACLVKSHGPFTWGESCEEAVYHAAVLEYCAQMAMMTESLGQTQPVGQFLLDRHYLRKHGENAYYGQKENVNG
ncbi:MAG: L-ribulose-5-phosphate 4-epimerase [Clostridiales bacterium]|nr:L-ribulose-5-phosphate 4-epimerase [Clostridiales bacterium]